MTLVICLKYIYIFDRDYVDIDKCNSTEINYGMLFENSQSMV